MQRVGNFTCFFTQSDMFSNWYRIGFSIDNVPFNCGEQAMMYYKAMLFKDHSTAQKILREPSPRVQKALGRQVAGFSDAVWLQHRESIMEKICAARFSQNPALSKALLDTAGTQLVEASPYDRIWGAGLAASDPHIADPAKWPGLNLLGKVLDRVRERLAHAEQSRNSLANQNRTADYEPAHEQETPRYVFAPAMKG